MKKQLVINGNNFADLEGFYTEIDKVLTKDLDWQTGHNLNAFNDLLWGGFGVHDYEEPIAITWINFLKSKADLGNELAEHIAGIIKEHGHIELIVKDNN
jgi:RNAse (barnase) inhibitor barstar